MIWFAFIPTLKDVGFPAHINKIYEKMIKDGLLHSKSTGYGLEVSLEFTRKDELLEIVKRLFPDEEYL